MCVPLGYTPDISKVLFWTTRLFCIKILDNTDAALQCTSDWSIKMADTQGKVTLNTYCITVTVCQRSFNHERVYTSPSNESQKFLQLYSFLRSYNLLDNASHLAVPKCTSAANFDCDNCNLNFKETKSN